MLIVLRSKDERKYNCSYCHFNFKRLEHLKRHLVSHTVKTSGIKPFKCQICSKFYSRFDSLKLHATNAHSINLRWEEYKHIPNDYSKNLNVYPSNVSLRVFRNKIQDLID